MELSNETKQHILSMPTVGYWSLMGGVEVKQIRMGTENYVDCVEGAWIGKHIVHRLQIFYTRDAGEPFIRLHNTHLMLAECIRA